MSVKDDFKSNIGDFGLLVPKVGDPTSDNGVLYTTEYYLILKRLGVLSKEDTQAYVNTIQPCVSLGGLPHRKPGDNSQDSPDNLIALAAGSKAIGGGLASNILAYGQTTFPHYVYNQESPGKFSLSAWFGRQPGLIGFLKLCAGKYVNPFEWLCLYVGIYLTTRQPKEQTSDKLLTQLIVEQLPDGIIHNIVKKYWYSYIQRVYGGINGAVTIYFGTDSPFSKYWK